MENKTTNVSDAKEIEQVPDKAVSGSESEAVEQKVAITVPKNEPKKAEQKAEKDDKLFDQNRLTIDILRHLTTLNTGLLVILSAFSEELLPILGTNKFLADIFIYSFFISLVMCMIGFVLSIYTSHTKVDGLRAAFLSARDATVSIAALSYVFALIIFLNLFVETYSLQ